MLDSEKYRKLRNGKWYCTSTERPMSDNGSIEENISTNSSKNVKGENYEIQILTQEAVNEQIGCFIVPLTRQLEELTRLVQGLVTTLHQDHYPRTDFSPTSGTATFQSDTRWSDCSLSSSNIANLKLCLSFAET